MPKAEIEALIGSLSCPYCAGPLTPGKQLGDSGLATCACGDTPILDGVMWLDRRREGTSGGGWSNPARVSAVESLQRGDAQGAVSDALLRSRQSHFRRIASLYEALGKSAPAGLLSRARRGVQTAVVGRNDLTFSQAVHELRNGPYADYLYQRFANPSLLAAIPVLLLLKELSSSKGPLRVLELGGGTGHANFLMQRQFPDIHFILTDADITNLYMARRFIAPRAAHICLDAEARLPFADHSIDAIYCQDAFHYMRAKASVALELKRVVRPGGFWLFPHLHNALADNPAAGMPLPPADYARLFSFLNARFFPESALFQSFHDRLEIDLAAAFNQDALKSAPSLTMIAGPDSLWRKHDLSSLFLRPSADLAINRIYAGAAEDKTGPITWPNQGLRHECLAVEQFLPPDPRVGSGLLDRLRNGSTTAEDKPELDRLIRDFVLVPMPDRYG